eukprot:evm.model.NODE_41154_length_22195_cov_27.575174.7
MLHILLLAPPALPHTAPVLVLPRHLGPLLAAVGKEAAAGCNYPIVLVCVGAAGAGAAAGEEEEEEESTVLVLPPQATFGAAGVDGDATGTDRQEEGEEKEEAHRNVVMKRRSRRLDSQRRVFRGGNAGGGKLQR